VRCVTAAVAVLAFLLVACGGVERAAVDDPGAEDEEPEPTPVAEEEGPEPRLLVVAKVAPLADMVREVAGDRAEVVSLIPEGADSHTFEPRPGDARTVAEADLFVANGLDLNDALVRLAEANLPDDAVMVELAEEIATKDDLVYDHVHDDDDHGHTHDDDDGHTHGGADDGAGPNPHLWVSVDHTIDYVDVIARELSSIDPDHADGYRDNAERYIRELEALDDAISQAIASIPDADRKLVTFHDSWSYFGQRYGIEVVAAVQPADFSEPSAAEVRRIIDEIRAHDVPAVFGSEVFPSDVLSVIAEETGAEYVGDVSDDALPGEPGDPGHSYVGMMVHNVRLIVDGLGGDPDILDAVDPEVE
jgi:ABC-type Zn uptake system ZnuABC Zn-binding protein ZnuA